MTVVQRAVIMFGRPGPPPRRRVFEARRVLAAVEGERDLDFRRCGLCLVVGDVDGPRDHAESVLVLLASLEANPLEGDLRVDMVGVRAGRPDFEHVSVAYACGGRVDPEATGGEIPEPDAHVVLRLRLLAAMAMADGLVDDAERAFLRAIAGQIGLAESEVRRILEAQPTTVGRADLPEDPAARRRLLDSVIGMALADGRVDDREKVLVRKLTKMLEL